MENNKIKNLERRLRKLEYEIRRLKRKGSGEKYPKKKYFSEPAQFFPKFDW